MFAGFKTSAEARSMKDVPVRPMATLRVSYAVGSGLARARVGSSMQVRKRTAASFWYGRAVLVPGSTGA